MIFTRGITCMRLKSASVRGWASGSARAAFSIALLDIGRRVFFEVLMLLIFRHLARRNNSGSIATFRISYEQQNLSFCHPEDYEALLSIIFSIVNAPNSERVIEYCFGQFKTHSVSFAKFDSALAASHSNFN